MTELKTLIKSIQGISKNPLFRNCANGDHRLMAALCLFFNLSHQFDFANYATKKAIRNFNDAKDCELTQESRDCIVLFNIEHAILSYSACYDKILQIVYFAFHFAKDFSTKKEFQEQLSRCRWYEKSFDANGNNKEIGLKIWFNEIKSDNAHNFFEKLSNFYGPDIRGKINKYANQIKHKGGISLPLLNKYIPSVCRVETPISLKYNGNRITLKNQETVGAIFKPEIFYPEEIIIEHFIPLLKEQNNCIFEFVEYLYTFMGLDIYNTKIIFAPQFQLPFYYHGTEQNK